MFGLGPVLGEVLSRYPASDADCDRLMRWLGFDLEESIRWMWFLEASWESMPQTFLGAFCLYYLQYISDEKAPFFLTLNYTISSYCALGSLVALVPYMHKPALRLQRHISHCKLRVSVSMFIFCELIEV